MPGNKGLSRILIIASNPIIAEGLTTILKTKTAINTSILTTLYGPCKYSEILKTIKKSDPQIIFISQEITAKDTNPKTTPFTLCRKIKENITGVKILIFSTVYSAATYPITTANSENPLYESVRCGADGYLDASASSSDIINATQSLLRGEVYLPITFAAKLMESIQKNPYETTALKNLSPCEIKVLKLMTRGYSNKKIARKLHLSNHTIKNHISSIMSKLDARSRTNAVAIAIKKGFIPF